jgi:hypothetical protein
MRKMLYWAPRILGILFIAFLSLFAMDSFFGDSPWYAKIIGFFIHLLPSFVLIVFLVMAWKKYLLGSLMFIAGGIFYIFLAWGESIWAFVFISGPAFLVGGLFILDKYLNKK